MRSGAVYAAARVWPAAVGGLLILGLLGGAGVAADDSDAGAPDTSTRSHRIRIDYYYEPGCEECFRVSTRVLPELELRYADLAVLHEWDLGVEQNYLSLLAELERLGVEENARVYMILDRRVVLCGADAIEERLVPVLDGMLSAGLAETEPPEEPEADADLVERRLDGFTLAGVLAAGLIDGINPCAISTLVFLVSVLALAKVRGRRLLLVGGAFCLASFVTYTALGFGLLRALHLLTHFRAVQRAVDLVLVGILVVLGVLSLRDGLRYRATRREDALALRLPGAMRNRIHRLIRSGLGRRGQVASAFGLGCVVTGIESVCTGQVYVPTLVLLLKRGTDIGRALLYLLLYNLMFIAPLVVVLVLTFHGLELFSLIAWSRRNVAVSKALLALFFFVLAALVWVL